MAPVQLSAELAAVRHYQLSPQAREAVAAARDAVDAVLQSPLFFRPGATRELFDARLAAAQLHADAQLEAVDIPAAAVNDEMRSATPVGERLRAVAALHSRLAADAPSLMQAPPRVLAAWHLRASAGLDLPDDQRGQPRLPGVVVLDPLNSGLPGCNPGEAIRAVIDVLAVNPTQLPPIAQSALAHLLLVGAAPFAGANGILGRAAAQAVLIAKGTDPAGRVAVTAALSRSGRPAYVRALQAAMSPVDGAVDQWVCWWCQMIEAGAGFSAELMAESQAAVETAAIT